MPCFSSYVVNRLYLLSKQYNSVRTVEIMEIVAPTCLSENTMHNLHED